MPTNKDNDKQTSKDKDQGGKDQQRRDSDASKSGRKDDKDQGQQKR